MFKIFSFEMNVVPPPYKRSVAINIYMFCFALLCFVGSLCHFCFLFDYL